MKVEPCDTHPWKMYLIMSFEGAFLSYRKFRRNSYKIKIPPGGMRTRAKRNFVAEATVPGARVLPGRTLCYFISKGDADYEGIITRRTDHG